MVKSAIDIRCEALHYELTIPACIELSGEEEKALENLFFAFGKARRLCYSLRQKYELKGRMSRSEIIRRVQAITGLNSRYVKDAYATIEHLPPHTTFGGLKNQRMREKGKITKEEYKKRRNSIIYARGEKSRKGNLNMRIVEIADEKYLRVNIGDRKWLLLKLFIPEKYMKKYAKYLNGSHPYSVLIKRKDNDKGYDVRITIRAECSANEGSRLIALDMNKSHIDFCVMDKKHKDVVAVGKINTAELQNTRSNKREHQIKKVAHKVKNLAKHFNADVFIGKLRTSNFKSHRKANRIVHQMPQFKLRKWIKHICVKNGVRCEERSEANTTKVGRMLSHILGLDVHKCSAIAFALKLSDFHVFKLLSGVSSYDVNGRRRGRRRRGSSPTGKAQHDSRIRMKCWAAMMSSLLRERGDGGYPEIPGIRGLLLLSRLKASLPFRMIYVKIW
ncbi:MAG: hypothetical protein OCU16_00595 [Candidatus Methanospirare jalkutatii]|nr:hypothetical protein [Candidatus Methanospirare jalkutatii]